jgi:hypothetical protein
MNSDCFLKQDYPVDLCSREVNVLPARYELNFYILFRRNSVSKMLIYYSILPLEIKYQITLTITFVSNQHYVKAQ